MNKKMIFVVVALLTVVFNVKAEYLSIVDFGAVPNDSQDDTIAIQSCIDAAATAGKDCFIPQGEYLLSGDIWLGSDAVFYGEGDSSLLTFSAGSIRALKNGSKNFYDTANYMNEIVPGTPKTGTLKDDVSKSVRTFQINTQDQFNIGDWIFIYNNRQDTWAILGGLVSGKDTPPYMNGGEDVLVKAQIAQITNISGNQITIDRNLDSAYEAGATIGELVGSRNIYVHDLKIINNLNHSKAYAIVFEQPFNARFKKLTIETNNQAGGIHLLHYPFRCHIEECKITNTGNYAVSIENFGAENIVLNNDITFVTGLDSAILVIMYSKQNLIEKNTIRCLSSLVSNEGGIYIHATSFENEIRDNIIYGASDALGTFFGANNNIFDGNTSFQSRTGISLWYSGANNIYQNNSFDFDQTSRLGTRVGIYGYHTRSQVIKDNLFSGALEVGSFISPNCTFQEIPNIKYLIVYAGDDGNHEILLDGNTFDSTESGFVLFN